MIPVDDFIFRNPDWASIPIRTVLGVVLLVMFLLAIRRGPEGAVEVVSRFRWIVMAALAAASIWGMYAYTVLRPVATW